MLFVVTLFQTGGLFRCDGPGHVPEGVLESAVSLRLLLWCCLFLLTGWRPSEMIFIVTLCFILMHCFLVAVPDLSRCSLFLTGWRPSATCFILIHRMRNIHPTRLKTSPFDLSRSITPSCHHSSTLFIDSNIRHFPVIVSHITKSWRLGGEVGSLNEEQRRSTKTCTRLTKFNLNKARDG